MPNGFWRFCDAPSSPVIQLPMRRKKDGRWPISAGPEIVLTNSTLGSSGAGGQTGRYAGSGPGRVEAQDNITTPSAPARANADNWNRCVILKISPDAHKHEIAFPELPVEILVVVFVTQVSLQLAHVPI